MSERRSVTAPPEMMNGSTSGRARSNSSMRAMRITRQIQEVEPPAAALELPLGLELQHPRDQAVPRIEYQRVQRALGARPVGRGELGERQLEEGVELHAFAAALRVCEQHAARADVAGADQADSPRGWEKSPSPGAAAARPTPPRAAASCAGTRRRGTAPRAPAGGTSRSARRASPWRGGGRGPGARAPGIPRAR